MSTKFTPPSAGPQAEKYPLKLKRADTLKTTRAVITELVQGIFTTKGLSLIYGASNTAKTFVAIDLACAIAQGRDWMGRKTKAGMALYLAVESPGSVENRVHAYQLHYDVLMPNLFISESQVNLFHDDEGTKAVIETLKKLEKEHGQKVELLVIDTLACATPGADENSGRDMGRVIDRANRIREECGVHVALVHHTGKSAEAGARGWSGLMAAVDTAIKVVESAGKRYIEITKSRDLGAKGEQHSFDLGVVEIGSTNFGARETTCVVLPTGTRGTVRKLGAVEAAVRAHLAGNPGSTKSEVVKHFAGRHEKGPVYRAMQALVGLGALRESDGRFSIAEGLGS